MTTASYNLLGLMQGQVEYLAAGDRTLSCKDIIYVQRESHC